MSASSASRALLNVVLDNDVAALTKLLKNGDPQSWRELVRYEFPLSDLISTSGPKRMREDPRGPKLMDYEIRSMSPLHCAAFVGHLDLVLELLEADIPVDTPLASGSTMLHLAAFAGRVDLVNALIDIYKADRFRTDRYGWTALHYAATEGQLGAVKVLLAAGLEVEARDQDGTTAAFRADINGHKDVVKLLLQYGDEDELLNVIDSFSIHDNDPVPDPKYSKPVKPPTPNERRVSASPEVDLSKFGEGGRVPLPFNNDKPSLPPRERSRSIPSQADDDMFTHSRSKSERKNRTLPARSSKNLGKNTVRRLLRKELAQALCGDYMMPHELTKDPEDEEELLKIGGESGIGMRTLKGIMREELDRYRREALGQAMSVGFSGPDENAPSPPLDSLDDTYESLASLPPAPPLPPRTAPPLPPRNPSMAQMELDEIDDVESILGTVRLQKFDISDAALRECFSRLAPQLGANWKRLARALPLSTDNIVLETRIKTLGEAYPDSLEKQALTSLVEWKINNGRNAGLDDLMIGLRKARLLDLVPVVDRISQEFTA